MSLDWLTSVMWPVSFLFFVCYSLFFFVFVVKCFLSGRLFQTFCLFRSLSLANLAMVFVCRRKANIKPSNQQNGFGLKCRTLEIAMHNNKEPHRNEHDRHRDVGKLCASSCVFLLSAIGFRWVFHQYVCVCYCFACFSFFRFSFRGVISLMFCIFLFC